jgi:hypothetical protein
MGGGGGFVSAITDPISDVLGTSGGDGGLLGAVEDVGGFIGDAGKVIDDAVIQPIVDDPVNTAIKLGAYYVGGPLGAAAASAGISAAQGNDIEDIARDAAISYAAGQVGGQVGGAVAGETGSQLAGNLAQGGTSGATSALLSGRDPVTGLLSGVTGAGISAGVGAAVDAGAGLFNQTNTGSTGMDENLFYDTSSYYSPDYVAPNLLPNGGVDYGQFNMNTGTGEDFNMSGDAQFNAYLQSTPGLLDYAKQFGVQAAKALIGGGSRPAGQGGTAGGAGTQGGLLGAGANYFLSDAARRAIQSASQQSTQQQLEATRRAEQFATFKPVGVTTAFGQSNFGFDPTTGQLTSAGYTATPQIAAQREKLFTLGAEALPTTADTAALQQQYLEQQRGLLAPSREQQLAQLRNRQYQRGTGGLATGGTVAGYAPGAGGLMQTNPEMAAYYNALAREDATLGANAPIYAQDLLNKRIATGTGLFTQAGALETMAQQPLTLGAGLGAQASTAGSRAGLYGLTGAQGAAQTQLYGNVANASGQLGQAQGLLTGVSPYLQQAGNYAINNWLS